MDVRAPSPTETPRLTADDRRRPPWFAPLALMIGCLSGASIALQAERAPAAAIARPATPAVTPVLSARRVPDLIAAPVAGRRLAAHLSDLMARAPATSCLIVAVDGHVVFSANDAVPLVPASIEKLMTAKAALLLLGPDAVLTTSARAAGPPNGGVVDGNLWMVGGGDPLLMTDAYAVHFKRQPVVHSDLAALADRIVAAGVKHIAGSVVGDESRYDSQRAVPQWPGRFAAASEIGPLSALTVNHGFAEFPPSPEAKGKVVPAADPATYAADQLSQLLAARGVTIDGPPGAGRAPPATTELAKLDSQPVSAMVQAMLTESDNGTAELLTKEMGVRDSNTGTTTAGAQAVTKALQAAQLPLGGTSQFDGSGLASENRTTCAAVEALLDREGPGSVIGRGLPVAGKTGTLDDRFVDTPVAGRLRAKTGTLNEATALAGYVTTTQGAALSFTLIMNTVPPERITAANVLLEEELGSILIGYPESVNVAALGPKS